jgi:4-hydroxy-4-methyl-2-oxoglutarate aldolase
MDWNYPIRKLELDYDVENIRQRYLQVYTAAVYDVLAMEFGIHGRAMDSGIYPLLHTMKLAGPAFTVFAVATPSQDEYIHNMRVGMLESMTPGCIQVRSTNHEKRSGQFGEISATAASAHGCVGAVVDGSTRDSNFLIDMGFPTFCRFRNPVEAFGRLMAIDYQVPIIVDGIDGNLVVNPGDFVFGDNDGVVIVPKELTVQVIERAEAIRARENESRAAFKSGRSVKDVYNEFGRF